MSTKYEIQSLSSFIKLLVIAFNINKIDQSKSLVNLCCALSFDCQQETFQKRLKFFTDSSPFSTFTYPRLFDKYHWQKWNIEQKLSVANVSYRQFVEISTSACKVKHKRQWFQYQLIIKCIGFLNTFHVINSSLAAKTLVLNCSHLV